jgi:hypothetical protein
MRIGPRAFRPQAVRQIRPRRLLPAVAVATSLVLGAAGPAAAEPLPKGVTWTAVINDRSIDRSDDPVILEPGEPAQVSVVVQNRTGKPVTVQYVRMAGAFLGLDFYVYTTFVARKVAGGATEEIEFDVDLLDLGDQATGLLPSQMVLLDPKGDELSAKEFQADVRGKLTSVYGLFGLAVGALTLLLLAGALWRLATGRLHPNRWRRGLTMAAPGLGIGFFLTFSLSALHVASPRASLWSTLVLLGGVIGFAAGYLSPNPQGPDDLAEEEDEDGPPDEGINFVVDTLPAGDVDRAGTPGREQPLQGR